MTSDIRDLTNFKEFPGSIEEGSGYHALPLLWHKDKSLKWRKWQIFIRLIKKPKKHITNIDWNVLSESQVNIKDEYYSVGEKIPHGTIAQVWVETGVESGKITKSAPSYFDKVSNEGRANERNVFQTALIYARNQWELRKNKGGHVRKTEEIKVSINTEYFPMLAKDYKAGGKYITFPAFIQPKLDGMRCLVYLSKANGGINDVVAYSRNRKMMPNVDYIKKILHPYLKVLFDTENNQSIYFDGELYKHGKALQDICGDGRNTNTDTSKSNTNRNEYHIYDCFYPLELDNGFTLRHDQLLLFFENLRACDRMIIKSVPTQLVENMSEASKMYMEFTKMGYEGAMLRNINGKYLAHPTKTGVALRSNDLVKMKPKFDDEFEVVDFTEGSKGKDKGAILWVCRSGDSLFNVTPKSITYEQRYALFADAKKNFDEKYKGRMLKVEYEGLSKNNIPLRAKALMFRDPE